MRQMFLEGMSRAAATVSIVTTDGVAGRAGVTVSAMCSVSADSTTPSLLICVHHRSATAQSIQENGVFCVNVLRDDQAVVADIFAGRIKTVSGDKFDCSAWDILSSGAPALPGSLVAFDCRLGKAFQHGSHWVFVGELVDVRVSEVAPPLVYANRAYGKPVPIEQISTRNQLTGAADNFQLNLGYLVNLGPYFLPELLSKFFLNYPDTSVNLVEGDERKLARALASGDVSLALTYDLDLNDSFEKLALGDMQPYVALPSEHPLSRYASISLQQLATEPMVLLDLPGVEERTTAWFATADASPHIRYRSSSFEMVRSMVGNGFGYSLLVTKPTNNMTYDGKALTMRSLAHTVASIQLVVAWKRGANLEAAQRSFAQSCRAHFHPTKCECP